MIKQLTICLVFFVELIAVGQWLSCRYFKDFIHFSSVKTALFTEGLINNDSGIPIFIVRFFHNKVVANINAISENYLRFWDIRFALNLFSVIGSFGIILGIWYLFAGNIKKRKYLRILLAYMLTVPLVEIISGNHIDYIYKIIFIAIPFQIFSFFGVWEFISPNNNWLRISIVVGLSLVSLWWMYILGQDIYNYCVR